jgi:tight adherence protein B
VSTGLLILLVVVAAVALLALVILLGGGGRKTGLTGNYRGMMASSQRLNSMDDRATGKEGKPDALTAISSEKKVTSSKLTIKKRLKFAQLPIPVVAFHSLEVGISILAFIVVSMYMNIILQLMSLLTGPLFMRWLVNSKLEKRMKRFDVDYPQFLLSLVGLLKTGMNPVQGLEAAAQGLEPDSLVREEVEMMIERLRFGVSEDKSIGAFGEDVYHPEIELFVQALLLSRRVGGTLSDTLERLAKQVRKRQYFRSAAVSAVGMQRGSIWIIIFMLCAMQFYMYLMYPDMIMAGLNDETGWQVWQVGICVILLGIFWVRQVTKIRV